MNRNATMILVFIGVVASQSSCGTGRQRDCEKHIREEIHPGVPLGIADAALKKCGFKTTIDLAKKTLYGDKLVERGPVSERTQVLVNLDSDNRVITISVTTGLIGP
jgi:hypothetical protein